MAKSKAKRVLIIDTETKEIREGEVTTLADMQKIVGGLIEPVRTLKIPGGHELYVNEEGEFDESLKRFYFKDEDGRYSLIGNAFVIGGVTSTGNHKAATLTIEELKRQVRFP